MTFASATTIYQVTWQVRRLFQRLRAVSDEMLAGAGVNASQRAVLEFLDERQPETVPAIARDKTVSRQHIQSVINELLDAGWVRSEPNPAHKRSPLYRLTPSGQALFEAVRARELALLRRMESRFDEAELVAALRALEALDAYFESGDWRADTFVETGEPES